MSSSFFLKKPTKSNKRTKFQKDAPGGSKNKKNKPNAAEPHSTKKRPRNEDEEIPSDDNEQESDFDTETAPPNLVFSSDEAEEETPQDKRLRLAKQYLEEIEKQEAERAGEREIHDHVAQRLQTEYLDSVGRLRRSIADSITGYGSAILKRKHFLQPLPLCTLALSQDGKYLFTGAKTQTVLRWDVDTMKVSSSFDVQPFREESESLKKRRSNVIALCLSSDMKFLALAEGGHNIQIWCPKEMKHLKTFRGHRDVVTALVFRRDTHELYSGAMDRSVKIWSLDEMAYVESLFGHQAGVTGIDALSRERAISSGGSDCSLRIWKITEESQLIYNGPHHFSVEGVKFINDEHFISSGMNGSLSLWSALKKKPLCTEEAVHGKQANGEANWITALACVVNTDLIASGSSDGFIRLWKVSYNTRTLKQILAIPFKGFINGLSFNNDGTKLFAAVGQEHRLGRWWRLKGTGNKVVVIDLLRNTT